MEQNVKQVTALKKEKLKKINALGINPYPTNCQRTHEIVELINNEEKYLADKQFVQITGRLTAMRRQGKIGFAVLTDSTAKIQIFVKKDGVGEENYEVFKLCDLGDFAQIDGICFMTERGQYSVLAQKVTILGKGIRPIPVVKEKEVDGQKVRYDEFTDIELRYRKRYLDLLLNPENKATFIKRSEIITFTRNYLNDQGFIEVETPTLQPLYGGANARPFMTHHNTLGTDLYLRIATELYLKRLIVGGFEKVYEIGKNFRNEGMDRTHNPEFTSIELYQAYSDLDGMMHLTEELFSQASLLVNGTTTIPFGDHEIELKTPWRRATMLELIQEHTGEDFSDFDFERLSAYCTKNHIEIPNGAGAGKLVAQIFERFVEDKLIQPTFVTDHPKEISPLAKGKPGHPELTERFEIFIATNEYANAFTELNDPIDQRERLEAQAKLKELGDQEANMVDEDFLEAMEYGMPPTGGLGIGIDRMIMLLTNNTSIKEVILFPTMKPE
ncbi:MAG: lysine--tRNA ligase [Candidatus Zophobacter franzmannii]|nr:lysine--tRNA ligase [Candidatus Zophobacter franzmannii]